MGKLLQLLFCPPPLPPLRLPVAARLMPGIRHTIMEAFKLAYYRGVYDGAVAGVLVTLLLVPFLRDHITKGVSRVADHF